MRQHGSHDVSVVNLPPSYGNLTAQRDQRLHDHGAVLKYLEVANQPVRVIKRFLTCDGDRPSLRSGDNGQVLTAPPDG